MINYENNHTINFFKFQEKVSDDSGAINIEPDKITDQDISNAFCSLAEIYLTDCWYGI